MNFILCGLWEVLLQLHQKEYFITSADFCKHNLPELAVPERCFHETSDKKQMIQVASPQTCRDMRVSYVPSSAYLSACGLLLLHLSAFMEITFLSRSILELSTGKREKVR